MIKIVIAIFLLIMINVPYGLLLKVINEKISFMQGYVCGALFNLIVWEWCIAAICERMESPGMRPVKVLLTLCIVVIVMVTIIVVLRTIKKKNWIGHSQRLQTLNKKEAVCFVVAILVWGIGASFYVRYVPYQAVSVMADVNRVDLFGITNSNSMVMLGYYLHKLMSISVANAVCIVIPISFYVVFTVAMWEVASALYRKNLNSRTMCFLAEAILVLLGDCYLTFSYLALHNLHHTGYIALVITLPMAFASGLRLYFTEGKKQIISESVIWAFCLLCSRVLDNFAFMLCAMTIFIFAILLIGRRYLPWLKSSKL